MAAWLPDEFNVALALAIVALACWGTWSNAFKAFESSVKLPIAYFYTDFSVSVCVSLWLAFALPGGRELLDPRRNGTAPAAATGVLAERAGAAAAAGALFTLANLLLVLAVKLAGLSVAFPLGIGTALVGGTVLTYLIEQGGEGGDDAYPVFVRRALLLGRLGAPSPPASLQVFGGVGLALLAVIAIARAHALKDSRAAASEIQADAVEGAALLPSPTPPEPAPRSALWKAGLCVISGLLMSTWNPLMVFSIARVQGARLLCVYAALGFFVSG